MDISLSNDDILELIDGKANVLRYSELENYDDINDAMGDNNALLLLYQTTDKNYGHWTCIFRENNKLNFFDPLGIIPDDEIDWIPKNKRKVKYNNNRHLTKLLYNSGYDVVYNEIPLQKESDDINTCGRHCAVRLIFREVPQNNYIKFMENFEDPDLLVTYLTSFK